mmetsp:Transcript_27161/g.56543  ORF Transcript_27161/g.56543 Transcript_27161/m.56543 type:complete len:200 (+) Transcript_27161:251-850(+)
MCPPTSVRERKSNTCGAQRLCYKGEDGHQDSNRPHSGIVRNFKQFYELFPCMSYFPCTNPPGLPRTHGNHRNLPRSHCFACFTAQCTSACHNTGKGWDPRLKNGGTRNALCCSRRSHAPKGSVVDNHGWGIVRPAQEQEGTPQPRVENIPSDGGPAQPPRVDKAPLCAKGVGLRSEIFCLIDLPFPPAKQHPTSNKDAR